MIKALFQARNAPMTVGEMMTATAKTIIDKFTATNVGAVDATLTVHIVALGGSVGASNKLLTVDIEPGKAYLCGELVGHVLESGDSIHASSSVASTIVVRGSGRQA